MEKIKDIEQFKDENMIWVQPVERYSSVVIRLDNPDKITSISWKASMDAKGNLIIKKPMNFDTQTDRDFFAHLFEAPEDMSKEEFYKFFEDNPIGMIYYNDLSEEGKRLVDTMEEIPTNF